MTNVDMLAGAMIPERGALASLELGVVKSLNPDGTYEVRIGRASKNSTCGNYCTANVGDRVLVAIFPNGRCAAVSRLGGEIRGPEGIVQETDPTVPAWAKQPNPPMYTAENVGAEPSGAVSEHNVATDAHNDIRLLVEGLTSRLNALADSDDTTLDQLSEVVAYIKANRELIESVTTAKVNVSDIIDNLTTNVGDKPLSAAQGVALKALIDAITVPTKASELENDAGYLTEHQDLSAYARKADIAATKYASSSQSTATIVKISDFGSWGTGAWNQKNFSMLVSSRAGEMIWVTVAANDSSTDARAIRLMNRYSKITAIYYSASESAIYVKTAAWMNNVTAHLLSNIAGDYVPTVAVASALASDAVEINIVEFGINATSAVVGDSSVLLEMGGSAARPTYNGADMAMLSDTPSITYGTDDLTAGTSALATGAVYLVYE